VRGGPAWNAEYEVYSQVRMEAYRILRTYLKAYFLMPFILIAPLVFLFVAAMILDWAQNGEPSEKSKVILICTVMFGVLIYWGIVTSSILDRARGLKK